MKWRSAVIAFVVSCAACSSAPTTADPAAPIAPAESAPDVSAILAKMSERYRTAKTYQDVGTFRDVTSRGTEHEFVTTASFRTRWVAPDRLLFDLHIDREEFFPADRLALWTPRKGVIKALFLGKVRDEDSFDEGLGALQGVSHGLTGLIPRWLSQGLRVTGKYEARGTVPCGASKCIELTTMLRGVVRVTLTVDLATGALRKYVSAGTITPEPLTPEMLAQLSPHAREHEAKRSLEPFDVEQTILFDPTFDARIDESEFALVVDEPR